MIRCNLCWKRLSFDDDGMCYDLGESCGSGGSSSSSSGSNLLFSEGMDTSINEQQNSSCYITSCSHVLCEACAKKSWERTDPDSLMCPACDSPLIPKNIFPVNLVWNEYNALALLGFSPENCKKKGMVTTDNICFFL